MKYRLIHFFSRLSNRLRKGKDQKKEWNRYAELSKNLNEIKQVTSNHLLVVRLDDIGDFVLFAGTFSAWLKQQSKEVYLLGNKAWQSYYEALNEDTKIQCIWLDKKEWFSSFDYRKTIIQQIETFSPSEVVYASYTRVLLLEGIIKKCLSASKQYAWESKEGPFSEELNKGISHLKKREIGLHETEINQAFFEDLNKAKIQVDFHLNFPSTKRQIEGEYFIICPGGNQKSKQWPARYFGEIANRTLQKYPKLKCVLVGGQGDIKTAEEIIQEIHSQNTLNLTGNTSLIELAEICKNAQFAFSNDTSAAHLCALQKTPVFVVLNGNRYGRFFPYPTSFEKVFSLYPNLEQAAYDWEDKMPIASIPAKKLWEVFESSGL